MDTTTEAKRANQMKKIKAAAGIFALSTVIATCAYAVSHYIYCLLTISIPSAWTLAEASVIAACAASGALKAVKWCFLRIDELSKK